MYKNIYIYEKVNYQNVYIYVSVKILFIKNFYRVTMSLIT